MTFKALQEFVRDSPLARDLVMSVAWVALVWAFRAFASWVVRRTKWSSERVHLWWAVQVRRGAVVLLVLGILFIWATEIRTMALSLAAIAVALVIATKEMLLCVMGSVLRTSSGSFAVGDRIEVAGMRGDVIDHGLFATRSSRLVPVTPGPDAR